MNKRTLQKHEIEFKVDEIGEVTGERFAGVFQVRTRLSHRDTLTRDSVRRSLLGADPAGADAQALDAATVFSELAVRIVDAPSWWTNSDNGIELADTLPVRAVYKAALLAESDAIKAATTKADEAKKDLAPEKE